MQRRLGSFVMLAAFCMPSAHGLSLMKLFSEMNGIVGKAPRAPVAALVVEA
jgi:hypothetical protein